jgi:hypothetical protein
LFCNAIFTHSALLGQNPKRIAQIQQGPDCTGPY